MTLANALYLQRMYPDHVHIEGDTPEKILQSGMVGRFTLDIDDKWAVSLGKYLFYAVDTYDEVLIAIYTEHLNNLCIEVTEYYLDIMEETDYDITYWYNGVEIT